MANNQNTQTPNPRPWATAIDAAGTSWPLRITAADALRLRTTRKVDLLGTNAAKLPSELSGDPVACLELAFDLTAKQRAQSSITDESDFLSLFSGDEVADLIDATIEAIIDFFPPSRREAIRLIWNRQKGATARTETAMMNRLNDERTLASLDQAAAKAMSEFDLAIATLNQPIR